MIKIIKNGNPNRKVKTIYKLECSVCGCVFEFEYEDVERTFYNDYSIKCPCCKNHLGILLDKLEKRKVEIND